MNNSGVLELLDQDYYEADYTAEGYQQRDNTYQSSSQHSFVLQLFDLIKTVANRQLAGRKPIAELISKRASSTNHISVNQQRYAPLDVETALSGKLQVLI